MIIIVDTNVLLRFASVTDPLHPLAKTAILSLITAGHDLHTFPQNHYELWVTLTRPLANNGLGMTAIQSRAELEQSDANFPILPEPASLYSTWLDLVFTHDCKGKVAHDARIVAAMQLSGITQLLTFNTSDFSRFTGISVIDPKAFSLGP